MLRENKTKIRNNISLVEAPASANHIFEYDKTSNGSKDYLELANAPLLS